MKNAYLHSSIVKVDVKIDLHNKPLHLKAIVVETGLLISHLKYLKYMTLTKGRSSSWRNQSIQAIRLLLDYSIVNEGSFSNPKEMFIAFAKRLRDGTVDEFGMDATLLFWHSTNENTYNTLIHHITTYSNWLYDESGSESALLNPTTKATRAERLMNLAAYNNRHNKSFLGHTYSDKHKEQSINTARTVGRQWTNQPDFAPSKVFREDKIWALISEGFARRGVPATSPSIKRYNLANVLITMLLHFGGLRTCEPFHIYVSDIIPNDDLRQIRVYHPTKGLAPEWFRHQFNLPEADRQTFLGIKYGLETRWDHPNGAYNAGWKNSVVNQEGHYFHTYLFGSEGIEDMFYELFREYLLKQRVSPSEGREHPFLFTNKYGDPLSMQSFQAAHKAAVKKIGLEPKLFMGGSPHCHRHSYATRLYNAGIDNLTTKNCMHHRSLESQEVYKELDHKKIREDLNLKTKNLQNQQIPDNAKNSLQITDGAQSNEQ